MTKKKHIYYFRFPRKPTAIEAKGYDPFNHYSYLFWFSWETNMFPVYIWKNKDLVSVECWSVKELQRPSLINQCCGNFDELAESSSIILILIFFFFLIVNVPIFTTLASEMVRFSSFFFFFSFTLIFLRKQTKIIYIIGL